MVESFRITFCGDTSLGYYYLRRSRKKFSQAYDRLLNNPISFFEGVRPILEGSDEIIVNLETVLSHDPGKPIEGKQYPGCDDPDVTIEVLKRLGVTAVTLANNHTMDYGPDKLLAMIAKLNSNGIATIGAGINLEEARRPYRIEAKVGERVKSVYVFNGMRATRRYIKYGFFAEKDRPGIASTNFDEMEKGIQNIKASDPDSIVIVCPHWQGMDYRDINGNHQNWCRDIIDAGADHVVAHGTHKADKVENFAGGKIFYSIGNFIFNSPGRYKAKGADPKSLIVSLADIDGKQGFTINEIMTDNKESGFRVEAHKSYCDAPIGDNVQMSVLPNERTEKVIFKGKVQHVGFRKILKSYAESLSIRGWVRNLCDGDVEALLNGTEKALTELYAKVLSGRGMFLVTTLSRKVSNARVAPGFRIRSATTSKVEEKVNKKECINLILDLFDSPSNPDHPLDLPQKITDLINEKAKAFYKARITKNNFLRDNGFNKMQMSRLVENAQPNQLTHQMLRHIEKRKVPVLKAISFHSIMMQNSEEKRIGIPVFAWNLDHKTKAYEFADKIGLRRPDCNNEVCKFREIKQPGRPAVLKPVRATGTVGVAFYFDENHIRVLKNNLNFSSWREFTEYTNKYVIKDNVVTGGVRDRWIVEDMILEDLQLMTPARDIKFYSFYGKVVLILEIVRGENPRHCFWSRDGRRLTDTGKYDSETWIGDGVSAQQIEEVEKISLNLPVPFMRIDMLKSVDGMVLGEFTPRPGQWDRFNQKYDRLLGEEYLQARSRLYQDLLNGKTFQHFPFG